jgi:histidinol-phosphatase
MPGDGGRSRLDGSLQIVPPTIDNDRAADLQVALELADLADAITTARFGAADLVVETKPDLTPVSDADRAVEQEIRARLSQTRPGDAVIGEEFGGAGDRGGRHWIVDPIDGTKNFVRGVPVWATLIALLDETVAETGRPCVGVVSAPALGRRWWAHDGGGAWTSTCGGQARRLRVSAVSELADASLSFSSLSGWATIGRREQFVALTDRVWRTRGFGDFWSYMLVAEGAVDLAAEPELSVWDMAALAPIVTEAGGRFTGLDGVDGIGQGNAAASNGLLHEQFLAALTTPTSEAGRRPGR